MSELYKILFEVLFLHEYYLTDSDQTSVFDSGNIADPSGYLATRMLQDRPSVAGVLQFSVPAATRQVMSGQQMRIVNSYSGFQVAVRVTAATQSDGSVLYTPLVPLAGSCNLLFLIQPVGSELGAITNGRMQRTVPTSYFFSNAPVPGAKTFPVLSNPIPAKSATYAYEQGELLNDGNTIKAYYYDGKQAQYLAVSGDGFVNESDRALVGTGFTYSFQPKDAVTSASFALKDPTGAVLKTITATSIAPLGKVSLDFSQDAAGNPMPLVALPSAAVTDPILYSLVVTGNGGYSQTRPLIFYDDGPELESSWGLIQVQAAVSDSAFSLLDSSGNLLTRVQADGTVQAAPAFQVRCKSLFTFRKYINETGLSLSAPTSSLTSFLRQTGTKQAGFQLTSVTPVPLTYLPYFFSTNPKAASPNWVYLPAPAAGGAMDFSNNQLFSVIRVPESKLFPTS
jgi:hypothetical protein